jgi:prephenate dehydratase
MQLQELYSTAHSMGQMKSILVKSKSILERITKSTSKSMTKSMTKSTRTQDC